MTTDKASPILVAFAGYDFFKKKKTDPTNIQYVINNLNVINTPMGCFPVVTLPCHGHVVPWKSYTCLLSDKYGMVSFIHDCGHDDMLP